MNGPLHRAWRLSVSRRRARHTEQDARRVLGMAPAHPEQITRLLPDADEEWLAAAADALWPADEYVDIITEHWDQP